MRFNARAFFAALFVTSGALAQLSGSPTSGSPAVTYPADYDAFVFCSSPDCTGTCEVVSTADVPKDDGEAAPNDMGFQSIYWYDPYSYAWLLYTCVDYYNCAEDVNILPNTCYNLYDNGVSADFYEYWYLVNVVY